MGIKSRHWVTFKHRIRCRSFGIVVSIEEPSGKGKGEWRWASHDRWRRRGDGVGRRGRCVRHAQRWYVSTRRGTEWYGDDGRAGRGDSKTGLACKFFLWVVRHFRGALLICFVARKREDGHKVLMKLCSRFWGRSARGKTTAGEEVNQRKQLFATQETITRARRNCNRNRDRNRKLGTYLYISTQNFLIHTPLSIVVVSGNKFNKW